MNREVRLVVCVNERLGSGQPSCVGSGNLDYVADMRRLIAEAGLPVPIVERECLGRCAEGPVMRIAPGGAFFTGIDAGVLPRIIAALETSLEREA